MSKLNQLGLDLIKRYEGFRAFPYTDSAGVLTIGYGHTGEVARTTDGQITKARAEELLRQDIAEAESVLDAHVDVPLTENQYAALVSFVFNLGATHFLGSTLYQKLNDGDFAGAAGEFRRWVYADGVRLPGLVARRAAEEQLFLTQPVIAVVHQVTLVPVSAEFAFLTLSQQDSQGNVVFNSAHAGTQVVMALPLQDSHGKDVMGRVMAPTVKEEDDA